MSMVSSSEPLTIWKSSNCRLMTQSVCSCDKQVRIISHGQATQISLTKCLHMNYVITVTNVLVSYPGSCWVRFWYWCHLIVYLTKSFLHCMIQSFSAERLIIKHSIPHHGTLWRCTIYTGSFSRFVGLNKHHNYESLIPYIPPPIHYL